MMRKRDPGIRAVRPAAQAGRPPGDGGAVYTRREALAALGIAVAGAVLEGCGGGSVIQSAGGGLTTQQLALNPRPTALAADRGVDIDFIGTLRLPSGALASYWGAANPDGTPVHVYQALVWQQDPLKGVRVQFDGQGLPTRLEQEGTGAFALLFWETRRLVVKLYQADGSYIGGCAVQPSGGDYTVTQLADSKVVGYFSGALDNLTDAIVTFTIGGVVSSAAASKAAGSIVKDAGSAGASRQSDTALTPEEAVKVRAIVTALAGKVATGLPAFAVGLLKAIDDQYIATGRSDLATRILSTALHGTAVSSLFLGEGQPFIGAMAALYQLNQAAAGFQAKLGQGADPSQDGSLRAAYTSPSPVSYRSTLTYRSTRPSTDPTGVRGIMASRETGTIPVVGYIQPSGALYMTGTDSAGDVITLQGTVAGDQVQNGQWQLAGATKAAGRQSGSGTWNANKQPIGQCQEQQNSGGQGIFSNTYDLGKCGPFPFTYQAYTIPDHFQIFQDENLIFDTGGPVSGGATVTVDASGDTSLIRVVVIASLEGTLWDYTVGCPQ